MNLNRMLIVAVAGLGVAGWSLSASADAAAGKAKFDAACADCHEAADFEGEDAKALGDTINKIASGEVKHKGEVKLSDAEIADVAAYMASGGK